MGQQKKERKTDKMSLAVECQSFGLKYLLCRCFEIKNSATEMSTVGFRKCQAAAVAIRLLIHQLNFKLCDCAMKMFILYIYMYMCGCVFLFPFCTANLPSFLEEKFVAQQQTPMLAVQS